MGNDVSFNMYSDVPVFNIKAVTQRTGISAPTLRAWERRYNVLSPSRSDGNYRLFSERDIAILNWLNEHLQSGMSISRAVALLHANHKNRFENESYVSDLASLRMVGGASGHEADNTILKNATGDVGDYARQLRTTLHRSLIQMDEQNANAIFAEALAIYTLEEVCQQIITPVLVQIGEDWHDGLISVTVEHFATTLLLGKFYSLFHTLGSINGPLVLVGCAPSERHEIGALIIALLLRRKGHNVRYLGADMPIGDLVESARKLKPLAIVLSVMMSESANEITQLPTRLKAYAPDTYLFIGGNAFRNYTQTPNLPENKMVRYLGSDLYEGLAAIEQVLH